MSTQPISLLGYLATLPDAEILRWYFARERYNFDEQLATLPDAGILRWAFESGHVSALAIQLAPTDEGRHVWRLTWARPTRTDGRERAQNELVVERPSYRRALVASVEELCGL